MERSSLDMGFREMALRRRIQLPRLRIGTRAGGRSPAWPLAGIAEDASGVRRTPTNAQSLAREEDR